MTPALSNAFRGRSVLVTGHTGFKGAWLTLWLNQFGARVAGYALPPPTTPSLFDILGGASAVAQHFPGDVRDGDRLMKALEAARPEVIFHLAALALVRESYAAPRETFEVNVQGTWNLLDAVRRAGRPCVVVVVTSDKCYENREQVWGYRECDPVGGSDPYSASKGMCELVVNSFRRSFFSPERLPAHGVALATARAGNVIGGGDWACDRIVPDTVRSLVEGRPVPVRNPRSVRPWQHVLEPLSGYVELAARLLTGDNPHCCSAWNFGPQPGSERSVAELVEHLCMGWGSGTWQDASTPSAPREAHLLRLNIDKAQAELGWRPRWSFATAVQRTARWYARYYRDGPEGMRNYCVEEIEAFEHALAVGDDHAARP